MSVVPRSSPMLADMATVSGRYVPRSPSEPDTSDECSCAHSLLTQPTAWPALPTAGADDRWVLLDSMWRRAGAIGPARECAMGNWHVERVWAPHLQQKGGGLCQRVILSLAAGSSAVHAMYSLASRRTSTCNSSCRGAQPEVHLLPCREVGPCSPSGRGRLCGGSGVATAPLASRCIAPRAGASHAHAVNTTASPAAPVAALHEAAAGGRVGIVIVDHGSRKAESNMQLAEFAQLFQQMTGAPVVECAHMEIAKPSIEDAIGEQMRLAVRCMCHTPALLDALSGRHGCVCHAKSGHTRMAHEHNLRVVTACAAPSRSGRLTCQA